MALIVFTSEYDPTIDKFLGWIKFFGQEVIRVNKDQSLHFECEIGNTSKPFYIIRKKIKKKITSIWFRNRPTYSNINFNGRSDVFQFEKLNKFLSDETKNMYPVFDFCNTEKVLGDSSLCNPNKITHLKIAVQSDLNIPTTLISTEPDSIIAFKNRYKKIIIKPISNGITFSLNQKFYHIYTEELAVSDLCNLNSSVFPCLVQEFVEKFAEIRIFYFNYSCYSVAIFSQRNNLTKVDYRRRNNEFPIRMVPFSLPSKIQKKIDVLMSCLELNSGSLDMILTPDGKYYFLEINPFGQFDDVSYNSNLNLEKKIAEWFTTKGHGAE